MRSVRFEPTPPGGSVRVIGVIGGEPLEPVAHFDTAVAAGFTGASGQTLLISAAAGPILLVGLGDAVDAEGLRSAAGSAGRAIPLATPIATALHTLDLEGALEAVIGGLLLGSYRFDEFRTGADGGDPGQISLVGDASPDHLAAAVASTEAVGLARDWVNRPAMAQAPAVLAAEMEERLTEAGYEVEVWDEGRIQRERLGGLAGVAAGSDRPPRMVIARLRPPDAAAHVALVGKGIVFDSGGLSIKSAENMERMKGDMAGAAAVAAAAYAVGRLGHPVAVSVFIPLTDNMSGGNAIKPGDVLTARNGKTIEVLNTDAEGRLVLADGLSLAVEEEPDLIVDVATLTGAVRVALGDRIAGLWSSDAATSERLQAAAGQAGERLWPMPLPADYRQLIDSTVADMKNTGGRYGGAIAAAALLAEFAGDGPWAHLDIAGPSWFHEDTSLGPKGGSGFGVTTLIALTEHLAS